MGRYSHWTPEGHCRYTGSFVPFSLQTHKNVVYDFQNYTTYVCFKSELLDPKNHLPAVMLKFLSTTPKSIIFKITTRTCVLKTNFYTHKKKSHVPALIFKFLTTTPNLTSKFETHKNIGKKFDYMYRFMYTLSMHRKVINIIEGYFGYQK